MSQLKSVEVILALPIIAVFITVSDLIADKLNKRKNKK